MNEIPLRFYVPDPTSPPTPPPPPSTDTTSAAVAYGWGTPESSSSDDFSTYPSSNLRQKPDPSKWLTSGDWPNGSWPGHNNNGRRLSGQAYVLNGMLHLHGLPNASTGWLRHLRDVQYGRWELRMSAKNIGSSGNTFHPLALIWPSSDRWPNDGEYDFLECDNPDAGSVGGWIHSPHAPRSDGSVIQDRWESSRWKLNDWHNYAFEWLPSGLKVFVDAEEVYSGSGTRPGALGPIQSMPSGALTLQLDAFNGSGMREAIQYVKWVKFYPVSV